MEFARICDIKYQNEQSWKDHIFITIDVDWALDEVLEYTLEIFELHHIKATIFLTHETSLIDRIRSSKYLELGIHPNFNFLLAGDFRYGKNFEEVIKYYLELVPNAKSIRSHSTTQNSGILEKFSELGIKYDSNDFIAFNSGIELKPWLYVNHKLVKVPYFWAEDVHMLYREEWSVGRFLSIPGLKVFNFHPIQIFLNTEKQERYLEARPYLKEYKKLKELINPGIGTRSFLMDLIEFNIKK